MGCWQASGQNYLQLANECFDKGDYECAKRNYNLYQVFDGRDMSAEIQKADECFRTLITADDYFREQDWERARDRYLMVLERNPKDPHAQKRLVECDALLTPPVVEPEPEPEPEEKVEVIEVAQEVKVTEPEVKIEPVQAPVKEKTTLKSGDYKKNVYGVDVGIGARNLSTGNLGSYQMGTFVDLGARYTRCFSPYLGWDVLNLKLQGLDKEFFVQVMTGLRGYSPVLMNNVKGYASVKGGYGVVVELDDDGFAYEFEVGLNLTKTFAVGFVFNGQSLSGAFSDESGGFNSRFVGLRIGLNF